MPTVFTPCRPIFRENGTLLPCAQDFDLPQTLDCGQAFRWTPRPDGGYSGIVRGKVCDILHIDNDILLKGVTQSDFEAVWLDYFDLDRDYTAIKQALSVNPVFARAITYAPGIRVLRQEPWEALCSFILSQNNNVPRIKGIIERFCLAFGSPLGGGRFAFPAPALLAALSPDDLAPLRAGFRARYLIDAAQKVASGQVDLARAALLPLADARAELMQIVGVGVKVADCALLYGCGRLDCFPVDVWIKRAMDHLFPQGLPDCALPFAGIAQQYLFHYVRTCPEALL